MKFIVIDGNSILNRAYYGIRLLSNSSGMPTNALYGFVNIINKEIKALGGSPDYAAIAFDLKAPTFRHKLTPTYKATRKGMDPELAVQLPYSKQLATALGFNVLEKEGFEADDILGTIASLCEKNNTECVIVTGDRDSLQLVSENVTVRLATTNDTVIYDKGAVFDKYGVLPCQLIDVKALMGDSSDNISGVAGIGEKGALKLIAEYKTLDNVYASVDEIKGSLHEKLVSGKDAAYLSQKLATICREVPISGDMSFYAYKSENIQLLRELYSLFEFKNLLDKLALPNASEVEISDGGELCRDVYFVKTNGESLDIYKNSQLSTIPLNEAQSIFSKENHTVFWSLKDELHILQSHGITVNSKTDDISLAAYILSPTDNGTTFARTVTEQLGIDASTQTVSLFPALYEKLFSKLDGSAKKLYSEIELPLSSLLCRMEDIGFSIDRDGLREYTKKLEAEIAETARAIYLYADGEFNINSTKQLAEVLFEKLKMPRYKKNKSGYSTDADVLEKLRPYHPIIDLILFYRKCSKLKSTYGDGLDAAVAPDGRIHTTFKQTLTMTGRLSSAEPNLQNIPVRSELGRELRRFFNASEGKTLIDADYSQIELRLLAHISGDKTLIEAFVNGDDIHTITASQVFGVPKNSVTPELRKRAKAVNFGIVYGIGGFSLAEDIGVSRKAASAYIENYFEKYPAVRQYLDATVKKATEDGFVTTIFGRVRYIPELKSSNKNIRAFGERVAMNTPIQGSAADLIKLAMVNADKALCDSGLDAKLILQIHDELIVEASEKDAQKAKEILVREMENAVSLSVPLTADANIGKTWFEAKE